VFRVRVGVKFRFRVRVRVRVWVWFRGKGWVGSRIDGQDCRDTPNL
jgi:hypothetical protein